MDRRTFLQTLGPLFAYGGMGLDQLDGRPSDYSHHTLSDQGCGRATGYAEATKIITVGDKIHFSWLDSEADQFLVKVKTFDRSVGQWSPTFTVGEAHDNHGGPALTVDSHGHLHITYFPHHHPTRYRKSVRPNDASSWSKVEVFGENLTYPTLLCTRDDTLICTARRSFRDKPWEMEMWILPKDGEWTGPKTLIKSRYPGYSHFQESLAWNPVDQSMHLTSRVHEHSDEESYGKIQTLVYLKKFKDRAGWYTHDLKKLTTPLTIDQIPPLEAGGTLVDKVIRSGACTVDPNGNPWILYSLRQSGHAETFLWRGTKNNRWQKWNLGSQLPAKYSGWSLSVPGGVVVSHDRISIVCQMQRPASHEVAWGHPSNEIALLTSDNEGKSFSFQLLSEFNVHRPNWLPSIERPTGHNQVLSRPSMMFTSGVRGERNDDILSNRVVACIAR